MTYVHRTVEQQRLAAQMTAIRKAQGLLAAFVIEVILFAGLFTMELCR